jgi:hypothetical protein
VSPLSVPAKTTAAKVSVRAAAAAEIPKRRRSDMVNLLPRGYGEGRREFSVVSAANQKDREIPTLK